MECPKCKGTLTQPYWEKTEQGKILTISCMNCGYLVHHKTKVEYYNPEDDLLLAVAASIIKKLKKGKL